MTYGLGARFAVLFAACVVAGPSSATAATPDSLASARQFLVYQCGNAICRVGADGKGLRHLTSPKLGEILDDDPVWSPDGRRIAFTRFNFSDESTRLYVMNSDGTRKRRVTDRYAVRSQSWSPDGTRIAFYWDDLAPVTGGDEGIYVIRANGRGLVKVASRKLSLGLSLGGDPWSPDGRKLVYNEEGDIYVVGSDGRGRRRLTSSSYDGDAAWSPDGKHLAFWRHLSEDLLDDADEFAYVTAADGTRPRRFGSTGFGPAWSPDSKKIAYADNGLRVAAIAARGAGRVVADTCCRGTIDWSPDGKLIAYDLIGEPLGGDPEDPEFYIYLARADGTKHWRLVNGQHPNWSPLLPS